METLNDDPGYACCFCGKGIGDDSPAVTLTGMNFEDWRTEAPEPRTQSFWAHFDCLKSTWQGSYPWEGEALFDEGE